MKYDEWCESCKEYDKENHCCPRFNHVIRTTLDDVRKEAYKHGKSKGIKKGLAMAQPKRTEERTKRHACDCISRQAAIDALGEKPLVWDDFSDFDLGKAAQWSDDVDAIKALPSAQPDNRLERIADIVEGTIDHLDRDDAMDMLYQIKEVLK